MIEIKKFSCHNCGYCCTNFRSTDHKPFEGPHFNTYKTVMLNEHLLTIYDWEAADFEQKIKDKGSARKVLPSTVFFDMKNEQTIVLHYTIDDGECPHHINNKCTIYQDRPLKCRQFPCMHDLSEFIRGKESKMRLEMNPNCHGEMSDLDFYESIKGIPMDIHKTLDGRYGNSYYVNVSLKILAIRKAEIINKLEDEGKIKLAKQGYDMKVLLKRIYNSKFVNFSDFCRDHDYDIKSMGDIGKIKAKMKELYEKVV